jgi:hypothetical protein
MFFGHPKSIGELAFVREGMDFSMASSSSACRIVFLCLLSCSFNTFQLQCQAFRPSTLLQGGSLGVVQGIDDARPVPPEKQLPAEHARFGYEFVYYFELSFLTLFFPLSSVFPYFQQLNLKKWKPWMLQEGEGDLTQELRAQGVTRVV